jgi:hypothetical protein
MLAGTSQSEHKNITVVHRSYVSAQLIEIFRCQSIGNFGASKRDGRHVALDG